MTRKALSTVVAERLRDGIVSGRIAPGAQLPTEAELCGAHAVSRTVIREAIARLRSEGLVIPRQGKGVFVSEAPLSSFSIPEEDRRALPQTIALLELRLAVEVEAAGLAAQRRTEAEAAAIRAEMERVDGQRPDPSEVRVHYDPDFHLAIARASGNPQIAGFLAYLQSVLVPQLVLAYVVDPALKAGYFDRIHGEHEAVVAAIERHDAGGARRAMRAHLEASLDRLRALAGPSGRAAPDGVAPALFGDPPAS